jgi:hypothetical protein
MNTANKTVVKFENLEMIKKNDEQIKSALVWEISSVFKFIRLDR